MLSNRTPKTCREGTENKQLLSRKLILVLSRHVIKKYQENEQERKIEVIVRFYIYIYIVGFDI